MLDLEKDIKLSKCTLQFNTNLCKSYVCFYKRIINERRFRKFSLFNNQAMYWIFILGKHSLIEKPLGILLIVVLNEKTYF